MSSFKFEKFLDSESGKLIYLKEIILNFDMIVRKLQFLIVVIIYKNKITAV